MLNVLTQAQLYETTWHPGQLHVNDQTTGEVDCVLAVDVISDVNGYNVFNTWYYGAKCGLQIFGSWHKRGAREHTDG